MFNELKQTILSGLSAATETGWLEPALIVSILVVLISLTWQYRDNLKLQKQQLKSDLKLQIYREIIRVIEATSRDLVLIKTNTLDKAYEILFSQDALDAKHQLEELRTSTIGVAKSICELLIAIERYEIVFLNFSTFRNRATELVEEIELETGALHELASEYRSTWKIHKPIDEDKANRVDDAARKLHKKYVDALGYCMDLRIAAQNHLLSDLFERKVPLRNPQDSSIRVYDIDKKIKKERVVAGTLPVK